MGVVQKPLCLKLGIFTIVWKSLFSTFSFRISPYSFSMKLVRSWSPYSNQYVFQEMDLEFFLRRGAPPMTTYLTGEETKFKSEKPRRGPMTRQ